MSTGLPPLLPILHLNQMPDRVPAISIRDSHRDTRIPGMFGSTPFIFKRPTAERRLNEGALSAPATESGAVVWRGCCFYLYMLPASILFGLV
jgi:hypothetical protein